MSSVTMAKMFVAAIVLLQCVTPSLSFAAGPPAFTTFNNPRGYTFCTDLTPRHQGAALQAASLSPVTFIISPRGGTRAFNVKLQGQVGGFIIQGRDQTNNPIGSLATINNDINAKIVAGCGGSTTMGHTNQAIKQAGMTFIWTPPAGSGTVTFQGTFVDGNNFQRIFGPVRSAQTQYTTTVHKNGAVTKTANWVAVGLMAALAAFRM